MNIGFEIMSSAASASTIIAVRELQFQYAAGGDEAVVVSIGIPVPVDEPAMW